MMNRNSILLRRRNKVIVPRGDGSLPLSYTATINKNLESLGYTLSKNVLEALATLSPDDAARFYEELVAILKDAVRLTVIESGTEDDLHRIWCFGIPEEKCNARESPLCNQKACASETR